jgi:hypothetical protein
LGNKNRQNTTEFIFATTISLPYNSVVINSKKLHFSKFKAGSYDTGGRYSKNPFIFIIIFEVYNMSEVEKVTVTVRLVRSLQYATIKSIVLHDVDPNIVTQELENILKSSYVTS